MPALGHGGHRRAAGRTAHDLRLRSRPAAVEGRAVQADRHTAGRRRHGDDSSERWKRSADRAVRAGADAVADESLHAGWNASHTDRPDRHDAAAGLHRAEHDADRTSAGADDAAPDNDYRPVSSARAGP